MNKVISVDLATTMGVAWINEGTIFVSEFSGDPGEQVEFLRGLAKITNADTFVFERLHRFRNARTTRSLLTRYGYVFLTLQYEGFGVLEMDTTTARAWAHSKGKYDSLDMLNKLSKTKLTDNMADAAVQLMAQLLIDVGQTQITEVPVQEIINASDIRRPTVNGQVNNNRSSRPKATKERVRRQTTKTDAKPKPSRSNESSNAASSTKRAKRNYTNGSRSRK